MRYLICYDIRETKIRTKVANYLEGVAYRVQYSVFMCSATEKTVSAIYKELKRLTKKSEKKIILIVPVCQSCQGKIRTIGSTIEDDSYCIIV